MSSHLRTYWYDGRWVVDTDVGLAPATMVRIAEYLCKVQMQRRAGLQPGPVRDECDQTIEALMTGKIVQNIAGKGDRVLFDAYKSDKIISLGTL